MTWIELSNHVGFKISVLGRVVAQGVLVAATLPSVLILSQFRQASAKRTANLLDLTYFT